MPVLCVIAPFPFFPSSKKVEKCLFIVSYNSKNENSLPNSGRLLFYTSILTIQLPDPYIFFAVSPDILLIHALLYSHKYNCNNCPYDPTQQRPMCKHSPTNRCKSFSLSKCLSIYYIMTHPHFKQRFESWFGTNEQDFSPHNASNHLYSFSSKRILTKLSNRLSSFILG